MKTILRFSLFSLAFVPLLVNFDTLFPFIFTKTLLIRTAITLFWVLFAVWFFMKKAEVSSLVSDGWRFLKNPLYIATALFILVMLVSTIFSVDPYKAFFGDIERGEGFLGMLHFFSFFVASLLVFDKKSWLTFFRLTLITGVILLADSFKEIISGEFVRAQSFVGNPTFTAGVFLFVIFSALLVFFMSGKKEFAWRIFSFLMIFGGTVGVFLTGTRGAILGLLAGTALTVLYFAVKGGGVYIKLSRKLSVNVRMASIILLALGVLSVGAFVITRKDSVWQKIPGVDRFTHLSLDDPTLQTRLISAGVSLRAINPVDNGAERLLIGYGWDNFNIAYNKHYNPEYMKYENLWFDRAHDKLLDVLVMTGVLGLIAYLGMWISLFYLAFRKIHEKTYAIPILFFGSAYFVQNLFVFDQISTYIPFFAFLAFAVFVSSVSDSSLPKKRWASKLKNFIPKILPYKLPVLAVFFAFSLVFYTFIPYSQSIKFVNALKTRSAKVVLDKIDSFTEPYNYAQSTIRNRLLSTAAPLVSNPQMQDLVNKAVELQEEFVSREPYDPRDISILSSVYRAKASLGEPGAYEKAEEYALLAFKLSPTRQDHFYALATLSADKGDFATMQKYAGEMLAGSPDVPRTKILYTSLITRQGPARFIEAMTILNSAVGEPRIKVTQQQEIGTIRAMYDTYTKYFSTIKDKDNFISALDGAIKLEANLENRPKASDKENIETSNRLAEFKQLKKKFLRDRKSTRLNSSHIPLSRMPSSA